MAKPACTQTEYNYVCVSEIINLKNVEGDWWSSYTPAFDLLHGTQRINIRSKVSGVHASTMLQCL